MKMPKLLLIFRKLHQILIMFCLNSIRQLQISSWVKLNPKIFDNLEVNIGNHGHEELVPFTSVAQTSVKEETLLSTCLMLVTKHVINSIIGSGLNMSGTIDPTNKFQIKVPIPNITTETKQENIKQLKEIFENLKNNHKSNSLNYVRSEARNKFQSSLKHNKISDSQHQLLKKLETLHKTYVDKLTDAFKQAEKVFLNSSINLPICIYVSVCVCVCVCMCL